MSALTPDDMALLTRIGWGERVTELPEHLAQFALATPKLARRCSRNGARHIGFQFALSADGWALLEQYHAAVDASGLCPAPDDLGVYETERMG